MLGELRVSNIPRGPAGQEVDIRFTYDCNGVLEVETTVVKTRETATLVITKHASHLNEREIRQAVQAMSKLKIHPREVSANRFLLKRAERLFEELPSMLRDELGSLMDYFENSLDSQEPDDIEVARQQLEIFLSVHDPLDDDEDDESHL